MANVFRATPEKELTPVAEVIREDAGPSLERMAAKANVRVGEGFNHLDRNGRKKKPSSSDEKLFKQPFYYLYELGQRIVVYSESPWERVEVEISEGKKETYLRFDVMSAKTALRDMLISFCGAKEATGVSLVMFAAERGFMLKHVKGRG